MSKDLDTPRDPLAAQPWTEAGREAWRIIRESPGPEMFPISSSLILAIEQQALDATRPLTGREGLTTSPTSGDEALRAAAQTVVDHHFGTLNHYAVDEHKCWDALRAALATPSSALVIRTTGAEFRASDPGNVWVRMSEEDYAKLTAE